MPTNNRQPDTAMAKRFLTNIAPDSEITFQTFAEGPKKGDRTLNRVLHGAFDLHVDRLLEFNNAGAGVFFMVNRGDGEIKTGEKTCRTIKNVVSIRAIFVDLDGAPLPPVQAATPPPTIIVESSPGKYHAYWPMNDLPLNRFTELQVQLAHKFMGDPTVKDLPRVLRVPGFIHLKAEPFMSRLIHLDEAA